MKFFQYIVAALLTHVLSASAEALERAKLIICSAARINSMGHEERQDSIMASDAFRGDTWQGIDLPNGRHSWAAKHRWKSSEDCWDQCYHGCLKPALAWGFDSAFCRIRNGPPIGIHIQHRSCVYGYTPDYSHGCFENNGDLCDDGYIYDGDHDHWWLWSLRDRNSTSATNLETWDAHQEHWENWYTHDRVRLFCNRLDDPNCGFEG